MTTLVLKFKNIENDDETIFHLFYSNLKAESVIMKETLIIYFNQFQFILKLYQAYKSIWEKFPAGLLIQC